MSFARLVGGPENYGNNIFQGLKTPEEARSLLIQNQYNNALAQKAMQDARQHQMVNDLLNDQRQSNQQFVPQPYQQNEQSMPYQNTPPPITQPSQGRTIFPELVTPQNSPYKDLERQGLINNNQSGEMGQTQQPSIRQQGGYGYGQQPIYNVPQRMGQIIETNPGNPRQYPLDAIAGKSPYVPKPEVRYQDGMKITTYPSKRETIEKVGQTPEEKETIREKAAEQRSELQEERQEKLADKKTALKRSMELSSVASSRDKVVSKLLRMKKLIEDNKDISGKYAWVQNKLGNSEKDQKTFINLASSLQAEAAHSIGKAGGSRAFAQAAEMKPNIWDNPEANLASVNSILQSAYDDYNEDKEEFERVTGKKYPFKEPPNPSQEEGGSTDKSGNKHWVYNEKTGKLE